MNQRDHESPSRVCSPDMSGEAIRRRIRLVDQLYQLGRRLARARVLGQVQEPTLDRVPEHGTAVDSP
jgi:hypothetical protein